MFQILKNQKFQEIKSNIIQNILAHQNVLDIGMSIARSVSNFAQSKSSLSFIEGGIGAFNTGVRAFSGSSSSFFHPDNGWEILTQANGEQVLFDILSTIIISFEGRQLKFPYETNKTFIYTTPVGRIGLAENKLYIRNNENKNNIITFLMKEKFKNSNSKVFYIVEHSIADQHGYLRVKFDLKLEDNIAKPSKTADDLADYIKKYIDDGITRSIILNGLPGTGKSSIAQKVFEKLNLNTLKFKYSKNNNEAIMKVIPLLLKSFEIDAVLLDDFDYIPDTTSMLEFLEWLHRHTKVVIAIANSLKTFAPAVLRPGRFDELRTIECLDEQVIRGVLGDSFDSLSDKVNKWPIAFINELSIRIKVNPNADPEEYISELQERINSQIKALKG